MHIYFRLLLLEELLHYLDFSGLNQPEDNFNFLWTLYYFLIRVARFFTFNF